VKKEAGRNQHCIIASPARPVNDKASATEPPEIRQLRLQIHQYTDMIMQATRDQKRLQQEISVYQGRVALSPAVEEQYKGWRAIMTMRRKTTRILLANKKQIRHGG